MKAIDAAIQYLELGFSVVPSNPKTKAPFVPWTEFQNRLPTKDEILGWFRQYPKAMVSVVTGKLSGITVIDADSQEAIARVEEGIPDYLEIPCVQTPRGNKHFYFTYDPSIPTKAGILPHVDTRNDGGCIVAPPSVNSEGKKYQWLQGCELSGGNLQEMPASLMCVLKDAHINNILNKNVRTKETGHLLDTAPLFGVGRRDGDLFTLANSLVKSGMSEHEIFKYLDFIVRSWGEHDETWINTKIQSALKRQETRERNLWQEIRDWVLSSKGQFLSSDVQNCLVVSSRQEKKNLSECLSSLVKECVIERVGNRNGCFRRIENHVEIIDFQNISTDSTLNIKFPFQIENYVKIMPKNVIVLAGEPNSGKTAFLLNVVKENMQDHALYYFSSEMGGLELRDRLSKFDITLGQWKCKFIERSSNFADVVKPDAINIIDFLEINDEFYKVAGFIKEIFDKLKNGVAIIALQKNKGTDYGLGGMRSLEKPRLYLAMETGKIKIVKGKNWINPEKNPNGLECDFKLVNGCKFIMTSGWKRQD